MKKLIAEIGFLSILAVLGCVVSTSLAACRKSANSGRDAQGEGGVEATISPGRGNVTGLDFPGSAGVSTTMKFQFPNPQLNGLPIWGPNGRGVTYIRRAYPRQKDGYYTTFFWGTSGQGNEVCDGILRGIQIYNNKLSLSDIQHEIDSPLSTRAGASSIWYLNINPTPSDISDKSGQGHDPEWVGDERPSLYTSHSRQPGRSYLATGRLTG